MPANDKIPDDGQPHDGQSDDETPPAPVEEFVRADMPVDASISNVFGLYGAPIETIMQKVGSYRGPRHSHSLDGGSQRRRGAKAAVPETTAPKATAEPVKPPEVKIPRAAFDMAAAPDSNQPKPDLTNDYLNKLIGWHREYERSNPRPGSKYVRIKTDGVWSISRTESWSDIDDALKTRRRNVESQALSLKEHIHAMRLNLTPERLGQLLDWFRERTGKDHCKHSTVWLKDKTADGRTVWTVASYRWREIERRGFIRSIQ